MKIAIYGGCFNPPHGGHVSAAKAAAQYLDPDELLIMPARIPPHKTLSAADPTPEQRAALCELAFGEIPCARVSDLELRRDAISYTIDTVREISREHPEAELYLLMGTDMLESFVSWYAFDDILKVCTLAVFCRAAGEDFRLDAALENLQNAHHAKVLRIPHEPLAISSTQLRSMLAERIKPDAISDTVYEEIIRCRYYEAKPDFSWLREQSYALHKAKRIAHVRGTEEEAVRLAKRWGADEQDAAEAAILHDITKKLDLNEQLILCKKYGIIVDTAEAQSEKLLHAKTGAALARARFGVSDAVYSAIQWHTTGRAEMSLLEKIIYMADYIEPNRDFDGLAKLRELAYSDLDEAMILGLEMSLEDLRSYGISPHVHSYEALESLKRQR